MINLFYKFKTKNSIRSLLLPLYGITVFFCWLAYSCSAEYEQLGYFIIHNKYLTSKYTGQSALNSIAFARYLASLFVTLSFYYTVSAFLSIKHRTMYDSDSNMEYVNCAVCSKPILQKSENDTICQSCKLKADKLRSDYQKESKCHDTSVRPKKRIFEETETIFDSMFAKLVAVLCISFIITFLINELF